MKQIFFNICAISCLPLSPGKIPDNKRSKEVSQEGSLESSLNRLLTAFSSLPASQRPTRVRRAARAQAPNETSTALSTLRAAAMNPAYYVNQARSAVEVQPAKKRQFETSVEYAGETSLMFSAPSFLEGF